MSTPIATDASPTKPATRGAHRRRAVFARLALLLAAIALGLLMGEVVVRGLRLAPEVFPIWLSIQRTAYQRSTNPILGYELKPNYRDPGADTHESLPATNAHGQRDIERSIAKPPGTRRILLLGDSVVVGNGIYDLDDTISRQLEKQFQGHKIEVLNFGVGGYCTLAEVELLRTKGIKFQPDLVVLLFLGNDYVDSNLRVQKYGSIHPRPEWVKRLFVRSALFRLACLRMNWFHFAEEADPARWHADALGSNNVERGIAELAKLSREHRFQIAIALWPGFADHFISDIWAEPSLSDPLRVEAIARSQGLATFRLANFFRKDWSRLPGRVSPRQHYTIGDTMHPNPTGARVAAEAIRAILESNPDFATSLGITPQDDNG
jgi:lysophospholipase L1-like esterase